jgi:PAS domain S-box-containing protein
MLEASDILAARILIVDDQDANVQLLEQLLVETGYQHVSASSTPEAVAALHLKNAYDLILLDLNMPVMNGFEVMQALGTDGKEGYLPVIALTADPSHKLRALQAGAKDFISKPFDLVEVKTRIHNMLEVRLLYKRLANYNRTLEEQVQFRTAELALSEERFRRLTELASDWYWEQNESGDFTRVSGPVEEMLGIRMTAFLGETVDGDITGWNEGERVMLHAKIAAREPFLDFCFTRTKPDGAVQKFRVSGEPMFDSQSRYIGYRGIGSEVRAG